MVSVVFTAPGLSVSASSWLFFFPRRDGVGCNFALIFCNACNAFNALSLSSRFSLFGWYLYRLSSPNTSGVKSTAAKTTVLLLFIPLYFIFCSSLTPRLFFDEILIETEKLTTSKRNGHRVSRSTGDALLGCLLLLY